MPTAFQNASRKRAAAALALYGLILAVIAEQTSPIYVSIAVVVVTLALVWRNLVAGLFVTSDAVVIRNVTHTLRIARADVAEVTFMTGRIDVSRWGYVNVVTHDGACHRVTSLRRDPLSGDALVLAVRQALAGR